MDDMTQQNAALVEQAAAAAASLHEQTVNLAGAVSVFQIEGVEPFGEAADEDDDEFARVERRAAGSPMRSSGSNNTSVRGARPVLEHRPPGRRRA
jgi:methyl-accepting chemotaxis protein